MQSGHALHGLENLNSWRLEPACVLLQLAQNKAKFNRDLFSNWTVHFCKQDSQLPKNYAAPLDPDFPFVLTAVALNQRHLACRISPATYIFMGFCQCAKARRCHRLARNN